MNGRSLPLTTPGDFMLEREFFHLHGRTWFVRVRPSVRSGETHTHLTLELVADTETRVVSCRREEWDTADPDFAVLVERSVTAGASHQVAPRTPGSPE
ncbi:MAG TPA: hypothetical protein VMY76_14035 [Gemmatimonadales bacterium]|nr:hypothetical protein [Gemmatimonadales bacterium]